MSGRTLRWNPDRLENRRTGEKIRERLQTRPDPLSEPPGAPYIIALTSLEGQFVPIRSTQV